MTVTVAVMLTLTKKPKGVCTKLPLFKFLLAASITMGILSVSRGVNLNCRIVIILQKKKLSVGLAILQFLPH